MLRKIWISEICKALKIHFPGKDVEINGLNLCNRISLHDRVLSYVTTDNYVDCIRANKAVACIILKESDLYAYQPLTAEQELSFIVCRNPEKLFYDIHDYLYYHTDFYEKFLFDKKIGEKCEIHPSAVIEEGVVIGNNVVVGANTVIRRGTVIRDNCVIGCNATIGSEGFQVVRIDEKNRKIVHCGGVEIKEGVFIGDNTAICNALFEGSTHIGMNAMIDNLIHVGHNGYVGDNAVVTAGTVLCGSSVLENNAWVGVNSSVLNRVTVGSGSKIGIGSVVTRDIPEDSLAYGVPAKVKIVFGGGRRLGVKVLEWLAGQEWVSVAAVCPIPEELDACHAAEMRRVIRDYHLRVCTLEEIAEEEFDLGLSVNYHRIIPQYILEHCKKGFYNVHHSYNLRLKGRNITTHAILNSRTEGIYYHGTTLHRMVPELDAGPIAASYACNIEEDDTAYTLFQRVDSLAFDMITEWFPRIAKEKVFLYMPPQEGIHSYKNADLPNREIKEYMSDQEMDILVRAFDFPGKEPAYIQKDKRKVHVVSAPRDEFTSKLVIHDRIYYTD